MVGDFTLAEFGKAVEADAFVRIKVVANWTHFRIQWEARNRLKGTMVTAKKGKPRSFLNPAAALALLRRTGVKKVEVEMEHWDMTMASLSMRMRPDVTARRLQERRVANDRYIAMAEGRELAPVGVPVRSEELMRLIEKKMRVGESREKRVGGNVVAG